MAAPSPDHLEAGETLFEYLVQLKHGGMAAKTVCTIAWWATKAGAVGRVNSLALRPDAASGHFSRCFDTAVGVSRTSENFYLLPQPGHRRGEAARSVEEVESLPVHEAFFEEVSTTGLELLLQEAKAKQELPPCYYDHPVVARAPAGTPVYPLALYLDGVQYTREETGLGVFTYCLLTGRRHLALVLRKAELCQCGCRGWCSFWQLWQFLRWSAEALAAGRHPTTRHDGSPWAASDSVRAVVAGLTFPWRAAFVWLKGDWAEFAYTWGFPSWASAQHPCLLCHCTKANMHLLEGYSPLGMPCAETTQEEYEAACRACELEVLVPDQATLEELRASLEDDRRPDGARGRGLLRDLPRLGLLKGDRLEPSLVLPDVCLVDNWQGACRLTFWRRSNETLARHRNPLLTAGLCTIVGCMQVDWLHSMSLGVFQDFLGALFFWLFLDQGFYTERGTRAQVVALSTLRLEQQLFNWYREQEAQGLYHTQVQRLKVSMLGNPENPTLSLHGYETNGVLLFAVDLLRQAGLQGPWLRAADCLANLYRLIKLHRHVMPPPAIQDGTGT